MVISLEGNDFAEAVVFVDDAFVENSGFVVVRLVHVFTNKIVECFCGHDDFLE
jgi:hypothetical protein